MNGDVLSEESPNTKVRLLDAAQELFSRKSFDEVSVRELAAAAGVNVAAVNYHFQGKENLFREVFLRRFVDQRERTLAALQEAVTDTDGPPQLEGVIRALVSQYLAGALADQASANFLGVIAREMHGGRAHHQFFFRELVAPIFQAFSQALQAARPELQQEQLNWIIASIVGQIHHLILRWQATRALAPEDEARAFMYRAFPALGLPVDQYVEQVTEHITKFSTAAVSGMFPEVR
jgi:AcrR family transcriptional regulator